MVRTPTNQSVTAPWSRIVACIDDSANAGGVIATASGLADTLKAPVTLFQVIDNRESFLLRPDPLESKFQQHQSRRKLQRLIDTAARNLSGSQIEFAMGGRDVEICRRATEPGVVLVIGSPRRSDPPGGISALTQRLVKESKAPLVVAPPGRVPAASPMHKLLVPLDGSSSAEAALVTACQIARACGAEIILLHVAPAAQLTVVGPLDHSDIELRQQLNARNERIGRDYIETQRQHVEDQGIPVRAICCTGEPRTGLENLIAQADADLIILSSRGQGARDCLDLSCGSVASYVLAHAQIPVWVVSPLRFGKPAISSLSDPVLCRPFTAL